LKRGRSQPLTHDYKRNGTATLFSALNAANGGVYGVCHERHRHQEWLKFLRLLDHSEIRTASGWPVKWSLQGWQPKSAQMKRLALSFVQRESRYHIGCEN
jgi:hypothetical protein